MRFKALVLATVAAALVPQIAHFVKGESLIDKVLGKLAQEELQAPSCLMPLQGGIEAIEEKLTTATRDNDEKFIVLVTASSDRSSQPAKYRFYEAAKAACSEEDRVASRWNWAHLDFEEEPGMIWRWWIWKVPIIVFVNRSSSASRPYDVRFWKIAWQMPKPEQIVSVIDGSRWRLITPWEGSLAPGGSLESVPLLLSQGFSVVYEILDPMPSWLLTLLSMGVGFVLIGFLHSGNSAQTPASRSAAPPSQRSGRPRQKPSSST